MSWKEEEKRSQIMDITSVLPEECISQILSFTSPRDASRLSAVTPVFKLSADSDAVWENFLPSGYQEIISNSAPSSMLRTFLSKKDIYFHLCHKPTIINNGIMSFVLEKKSGKKCYMVGARGLSVAGGRTAQYWKWPSLSESRFSQVAELDHVWWLEVEGSIDTNILCPCTTYGAYLVFKFGAIRDGFEGPVKLGVYFEGRDDGKRHSVLLNPPQNMPQLTPDRGDGWMEIEMGEFFIGNVDDRKAVFCLYDVCSRVKRGLIIEGIELRPKNGV